MTLQQLEYILAVDQFSHFARAAEYCRVTQPTLSAMIQKLEEELDTRIFDRSQQPVCPTPVGIHIIEQAQNILVQANRIKNIIEEEKHSLTGTFKLGIFHRSSLPPAPFLSAADEEIPQPRHPGSRNENKRHQESPADGRNRCRYRSESGRYGRVAADAVVL